MAAPAVAAKLGIAALTDVWTVRVIVTILAALIGLGVIYLLVKWVTQSTNEKLQKQQDKGLLEVTEKAQKGAPSAENPSGTPEFWATELNQAVAGFATDYDQIKYVITNTTEPFFMFDVNAAYKKAYGESAVQAIDDEWTVDYEDYRSMHKVA